MDGTKARKLFRDNLNRYMAMRHVTQSDIVAALGITASTMSDWCLGKKYPRVDSMQRLADFLEVPMSTLTGKMESGFDVFSIHGIERPKWQRVPLLGDIACGTPILAEQNIEEEVEVSADVKCDFVLRCKGDSMAPRLLDGDLVMIRQQPDVENGQIAAVLIDNEATLKRVYHLPGRTGLHLMPENTAFEPVFVTSENSDSVMILGRAVAYHRRIG